MANQQTYPHLWFDAVLFARRRGNCNKSIAMESSLSKAPAWEACKENVLPIKRGRSAKGLSDTLLKSSDSLLSDKLCEKAFEDAITAAGKSSPKELLDAYIMNFKWIRDTYPSSTEKALKLLEVFFCHIALT